MWEFIADNIATMKDSIQIIFFIIIATLSILTYLKAKKTLLQPIKTEVFKEQIKAFSSVLKFFSGKGEVALREELAFDDFFYANCFALYDSYARLFFEIQIDIEKRPYRKELCPTAIFSEERLTLADEYVIPEKGEDPSAPDPNTRASIWLSNKNIPLRIPQKMSEAEDQIEKFIQSPVLPKNCIKLIEKFREQLRKNIMMIEEILLEASKDMPVKYPNFEIMKKASTDWIYAKYTERFEHLEPHARTLTDFIREYYLTDDLLD